uniref:Cytochrome b561 domain-containing protein n=1 Tax=Parastrongyloides trichosuri TaxID=131310 RepID=A0A0N5A413_PARTI
MHGYIWALNQYIDMDLSEKSTIVIVEHHLNVVGIYERILHSILITIGVIIMSLLCKYHQKSQSIWHFLKLTIAVGGLCGISRCFQMKQRLYPTLHESFFSYLVFFISGACILIQFDKVTFRGKQKSE